MSEYHEWARTRTYADVAPHFTNGKRRGLPLVLVDADRLTSATSVADVGYCGLYDGGPSLLITIYVPGDDGHRTIEISLPEPSVRLLAEFCAERLRDAP